MMTAVIAKSLKMNAPMEGTSKLYFFLLLLLLISLMMNKMHATAPKSSASKLIPSMFAMSGTKPAARKV